MHIARACALALLLAAPPAHASSPVRVLVLEAADPSASGDDIGAAQGAVVGMGRPATVALIDLAVDTGEPLGARHVALRLLARIGGPDALEALGAVAARSDEPELRWAATEALATFEGDEVVQWLVPLLWDPTTAPTAMWLLSERASRSLLPVFAVGLADATTAPQALQGLAMACTPEAAALIGAVADRSDPASRADAAAALLRCGAPEDIVRGLDVTEALPGPERARVVTRLVAARPPPATITRVLEANAARSSRPLSAGEPDLIMQLALIDAPAAARALDAAPWADAAIEAALSVAPPQHLQVGATLARMTALPRARAAARDVLRGTRAGAWGPALAVLGDARDAEDCEVLAACLAGPLPRATGCLGALSVASRAVPQARQVLEDALDGLLPVADGLDLTRAAWRSGAPSLVDRVRGRGVQDTSGEALDALARRPLGPPERAALLAALRDPTAARAALDALGSSGDADAVGAVEAWTSRARGDARSLGLRTLGLIGSRRAVDYLASIARSPGHPDRLAATGALGLVRTAASSAVLTDLLDPTRPAVFVAAAAGLEKRPADHLAPALVAALGDPDERVAVAAARALAAAGEGEQARAALIRRVDSLTREGRMQADVVLTPPEPQRDRPPAAPTELPALIPRGAAARAPLAAHLRAVVDGSTRGGLAAALLAGLGSWDPEVRDAATALTETLCDEEEAAALEAALRDAPAAVSREAAKAALARRAARDQGEVGPSRGSTQRNEKAGSSR